MPEPLPTPKVFISYSWTTDDHVEWVVNLATRLVGDGVDVTLDQWDLTEGQDKYVFMEQMVTNPAVTKVLVICDKKYAEKANNRAGGVGTETQIISKEVYDKVSQEKFIPIICERDDDGKECVPVFFHSRIYIDFSKEDEFETAYDRLIRNLFGKPERIKPALGKPPAHLLLDSAPAVAPAPKLERLKDAVHKGKSHIQVLVQDYLDTFLGCMDQFRVTESVANYDAFDAALDKSIESFTPFRDCFIDFVIFFADYLNDAATRDRIAAFLESLAPFQEPPANAGSFYEIQYDNYKFLNSELVLYLIAGLIKKRAYESAAFFIEHRYIVATSRGRADYDESSLTIFNHYLKGFDEIRNQKKNLNLLSIAAGLIMNRATTSAISAKDLLQTDFLLFIRSYFPMPLGGIHWYPRLAVYLGRTETFELFARAVTDSGLAALKILLKVKDLPDLAVRLNKMINDQDFNRTMQPERLWHSGAEPARLLNIERITGVAQKDS